MKTVLIVSSSAAYEKMFKKEGFRVVTTRLEVLQHTPDLICFTGGSDVSPHLYGENNVASGCDALRDEFEMGVFSQFPDTPKVGICRGGQFLNVMMGGKMFQDCDKHAIGGTHEALLVETGEVFNVTSTHHQMMRPHPTGKVLVTAERSTVRCYGSDLGTPREVLREVGITGEDVEVVQYGDKVLCFQPHPEYGGNDDTRELFFRLLKGIV